jgi:hypothetical protein
MERLESIGDIRARLGSEERPRFPRLFILAPADLAPDELLQDFLHSPTLGTKLFIVHEWVPAVVSAAVVRDSCTLRCWIDFDASVDLFGPAAWIESLDISAAP